MVKCYFRAGKKKSARSLPRDVWLDCRLEFWVVAILSFRIRRSWSSFCAKSDFVAIMLISGDLRFSSSSPPAFSFQNVFKNPNLILNYVVKLEEEKWKEQYHQDCVCVFSPSHMGMHFAPQFGEKGVSVFGKMELQSKWTILWRGLALDWDLE